jgi:anti-sigma B factor antagonist
MRPDAAGADRICLPGRLIIEVAGRSGTRTVVRVAGRLDARAAPALARELVLATPPPRRGPPQVAIDLSGVTYVDGAGLQVLLDAQDRLAGQSGELELLSPTPAVVRLLHEAHLHGTASLPRMDDSGSGRGWNGSSFGGRPDPPIR